MLIIVMGHAHAFQPSVQPLLLNQEDWLEFGQRQKSRLHPNSPLKATTRTTSDGMEIVEYVGNHKPSNFRYSMTVTKNGSGYIKKVVETMTDQLNEKGKPIYRSQVLTFHEDVSITTRTQCEGELVKKAVDIPHRLQSQSGERVVLQYHCRTLNKDMCSYYDYAEPVIKRTKDQRFAIERLEDRFTKDPSFQNVHKKNLNAIKTAIAPGGRQNALWPKDELLHHYEGFNSNSPLNENDLKWLADNCKSISPYFVGAPLSLEQMKRKSEDGELIDGFQLKEMDGKSSIREAERSLNGNSSIYSEGSTSGRSK